MPGTVLREGHIQAEEDKNYKKIKQAGKESVKMLWLELCKWLEFGDMVRGWLATLESWLGMTELRKS